MVEVSRLVEAGIVPTAAAAIADQVNITSSSTRYERASRILRAAQRGIAPIANVMAAPPTITEGAANVASTINAAATSLGAQQYSPINPAIEQIGIFEVEASGYRDKSLTSDVTTGVRRSTKGSGLRFATDAPAFDVCINSTGTLTVYVTDMATGIRARVATNDLSPAVNSSRYLKFDFGSAGNRIIEFYCDPNLLIRGFNVGTTSSIWKAPASDEPRGAVVWDSYGEYVGSGATNLVKLSAVDYLAERLGMRNLLSLSRAGSGFMRNPTNFGTFAQRIANGDLDQSRIGALDFVLIPGTINDRTENDAAFTDSALQEAVQSTIQTVMNKQPTAFIFSCGPQITKNVNTAQARYDAMRAGFNAAAGGDGRMFWLDNSPSGENWLYGTASTGNVSIYDGPDNTHFNDAGMPYGGRRMGNSIVAAVQARFGG